MTRLIGLLATVLSVIGLVGCLAALVGIWIVRPEFLRSSDEYLETADDELKLVEDKATRADEMVKRIQGVVDPITAKIIKLADRADRTPDDDQELRRIDDDLAERLRQVESIADTVETAVTLMNKTSRMTKALRPPASRPSAEDVPNRSEALVRLAARFKELRTTLAKIRENREANNSIVDRVVRIARDLDDNLKRIDTHLQRVRQEAGEWQTEVAELRTTIPTWTNATAVVGSLVLAWLALGQFVLLQRASAWMRPNRAAPSGGR